MPSTIALIGCLDTKGDEFTFLENVIDQAGAKVHLIDTGILDKPRINAETGAQEVAQAGGTNLDDLRAVGDRGQAVTAMAAGAARIVRQLFEDGEIQGIVGAGGSANSTIASAAMQTLPVGFPKILVSTLASGDVSPYVDTKDVTMMYSVVDIAGVNRISRRILGNAGRAIVAMANGIDDDARADDDRPLVAASMFGVTTPCVTAARRVLEDAGYEVLVFHATGSGGRAMEGLIEDGYIQGVLDLTTTEIADEVVGGILSAGPKRLTAAARAGIPQVVSVGATDMVNFGPRDTVPAEFAQRELYEHNATVTLMRTTPEECAEIGKRIAERLNPSRAATKILLPTAGVSAIATEGQPFFDADADRRCRESIKEHATVEVEEVDAEMNDESFARRCAETLIRFLEST